jgi:ribonuclease HII
VHPGYNWVSNKGYASADHYAGIAEHGPSPLHRWSWLHAAGEPQATLFDLPA